jgi:uncharacterized protein (DUF433 family)
MIATPPTLSIPLHTDEGGAIRVSDTRVTLDVIIARYQQGLTPEDIHESFPTVSVTDIYAVISYYLANQLEVDAYLARRDADGERLRQEIEAKYPPRVTRAQLVARLEVKRHTEKMR